MNDIHKVKSWKYYFQKYGVEKLGNEHRRQSDVKVELLDEFKAEVYDEAKFRLGDAWYTAPDNDKDARRIAGNILKNAVKKWKRLCEEFAKYRETAGMISLEDLKLFDEDDSDHDGDKKLADFGLNDIPETDDEVSKFMSETVGLA